MESVNARRALLLARMEREDRELDQQDPQLKYDEVQVVAHRPVLMRPRCSYLNSVQLPRFNHWTEPSHRVCWQNLLLSMAKASENDEQDAQLRYCEGLVRLRCHIMTGSSVTGCQQAIAEVKGKRCCPTPNLNALCPFSSDRSA